MLINIRRTLLTYLAPLLLVSPHAAIALDTPLTSTPSQSQATLEILNTLDQRHFLDLAIDDQLSARFLDSYIKRLDPNKRFFLQSDIDEFKKKQFLLDDELLKGQNSTGFMIYERLTQRMEYRLDKMIKALSVEPASPINFSIDETLIVDEEKLVWPETIKEADDLWRKRVKSYFLSQKLSGKTLEKARETLLKRYRDQKSRIEKNTPEDIYEIYINAFTELYDPHTNYFSPRASKSFSIRMSLSLEGIGAVLQSDDGYTKVVRIVTAGPADKQGQLKPSDRIAGVAQGEEDIVNVIGWRLDEVVELIRGPKDSIVRLEVIPAGKNEDVTRIIEIKRDKVKLEDQAAQKAVINIEDKQGNPLKVGIINIPTFYLDFEAYRKRDPNYRSTTKDVRRLLSELGQEGVDGVVVDLRNNGGGSLYEATAVTDLFIDQGPVVQIGKDGGKKSNDYSRNNARYRGPLIVLINRLSASASEIFAGAVQDYNRGIIVGSQSFGKGTVQTLTPLKSQGELKITESKFYRVSGDSTQHRGIIPDILMPELVDPSVVGESSYDTALAWSKTHPVPHASYFSLNNLLTSLSQKHQKRINSNPDFVYLNERKALLKRVNDKKVISLKEATRLKEKTELESLALRIENKHRKHKNLEVFKTYEDFKTHQEKEDEEAAATQGTTTIDTEDDAVLKEAGYIMKDFIHLLKTNQGQVAASP